MANNLRLAYDEFGDPSKPAIILVMGLGTQMIAWPEALCQGLADQGFRVIRFDNRDIGLSQQVEPKKQVNLMKLILRSKLGLSIRVPYTLRDMAADAIGVLDFLEIDRAHWVGASMGGMICQVVAAEHPERTLSLTSIMSTSGNPALPQPGLRVAKQLLMRPNRSNEKAYLKHGLETWAIIGSPDYPPNKQELSERILASLRRSYSPNGYTHQMAAIMESGDRRHLLRKIKVPTQVIHGKSDVLVPVEGGIDTAKHIKNSKLELIEGMGHDLPRQLIPRFITLICNAVAESKKNDSLVA
ncbi:MAG: pimeloyl-ACP methyl ester carboxylesterase [Arenicella sp.]|jgi:pimeloyl-ACP methyl ester carboxylesterase